MCGIAGAIAPTLEQADEAVAAMCARMAARGPDDAGMVSEQAERGWVALGSRRLAVVDLSSAGHQPMRDPDRGTSIVYNGMIYNFQELRDELHARGVPFSSNCDTEVVLKAYGYFGADCVKHLHGMFAFAIWDASKRELFLARDRLGIKPLYYAHRGGDFLFASEVKALLRTGRVAIRLSPEALNSYLAFGGVSEPLTAIDGILQLPAGHTAVLRGGQFSVGRYWDFPSADSHQWDAASLPEALQERLAAVVRQHLISDAPLGVFLSGGLDSSLLAAIAVREGGDVRTVSVSFDEASFDESPYAERIASHIGSNHTDIRLRSADLLEHLDCAFEAMDQPSMDGLNIYVVSEGAKAVGLTVALSGLGADELFDGYRYSHLVRRLERLRSLPNGVAVPLSRLLGAVDGRAEKAAAWLAGETEPLTAHEVLRRVCLPSTARDLNLSFVPRFDRTQAAQRDIFNQVAVGDLDNYTKNVLLRDADGMSMAHSLEVRVPFLDDRLVEWVLRLPSDAKRGRPKQLLRSAATPLLPSEVLNRRKQGFALPLPQWMRGELRRDIENRLADPPNSVATEIEPIAVRGVWQRYLRDGGRWTPSWALYALCRWAETLPAADASRS